MFRSWTVDSIVSLWILYNSSKEKNYLFVMWLHQWSLYQICLNENNIQNVGSFLFNLLCTICIEFWWPFSWLLLCTVFIYCFYCMYCILVTTPTLFFIYSFTNIPAAWRTYVQVPSRGLTLLEHFFLYVYVCIIIRIRIRIVINTFLKVTHKVRTITNLFNMCRPVCVLTMKLTIFWLLSVLRLFVY